MDVEQYFPAVDRNERRRQFQDHSYIYYSVFPMNRQQTKLPGSRTFFWSVFIKKKIVQEMFSAIIIYYMLI
jgi:hypothetical protein